MAQWNTAESKIENTVARRGRGVMRPFPFFLLLTHFHHVSLVLAFLIPSFPFRTEESDTCANLPYFGCLSVISWYCPGTVLF